jgi:hypothetical protein
MQYLYWMQYLNCESPSRIVPIPLHIPFSANLAKSSPERTVFISWISRIICTFSTCALFLSTYSYRNFTMPEGVSASQSSVDKTHAVNGKSTTVRRKDAYSSFTERSVSGVHSYSAKFHNLRRIFLYSLVIFGTH